MTRPWTVMNRWGRDLVPPHSLAPQSPCEVNGCPNEGVAWQYGLWVCGAHIDGYRPEDISVDESQWHGTPFARGPELNDSFQEPSEPALSSGAKEEVAAARPRTPTMGETADDPGGGAHRDGEIGPTSNSKADSLEVRPEDSTIVGGTQRDGQEPLGWCEICDTWTYERHAHNADGDVR